MGEMPSDPDFVAQLEREVKEYLRAIDAWEQEHVQSRRRAGAEIVRPDLVKLYGDFAAARRTLQISVPRARRLCMKYGLRNPFPGVLHVELGAGERYAPALGRGERGALLDCLNAMGHAVLDERLSAADPRLMAASSRTWWRRIVDFFV